MALSLYLEHASMSADDPDMWMKQKLTSTELKLERQLNIQLLAALQQLHDVFIVWSADLRLHLLRNSPAWRAARAYSTEVVRITDSPPLPVSLYAAPPDPLRSS